jgi:hypothetical protein
VAGGECGSRGKGGGEMRCKNISVFKGVNSSVEIEFQCSLNRGHTGKHQYMWPEAATSRKDPHDMYKGIQVEGEQNEKIK